MTQSLRTSASSVDEDCGSLDLQGAVVTSSTGEELLLELLLRKSFFGAIYQARPRQSDKLFAVKVIRLDERAEDTLIAEDKFGDMRFRHLLHGHPHVLTPLDVFRTEAFLFIVTPLAEYQDLQACLDVALPEPEARYIFKQVCEAVGFVHRQRATAEDRQSLAHLRGDWPPEAEVLSDDVKQLL